jgi:predicted peptidase
MKKRYLRLIAFIFLLSCVFCEKQDSALADLNPEETFEDADAPVEHVHENLSFHSPWGYEKADNASRFYPLLVSGMWGEGEGYYQAIAQDYPAFVIDYQKNSASDGQALGQWIKSAINSGYRIDLNRIYLTGFSYGGSSSYPLAKGMYAEDMYFAAIIRVAGQSQSDLGNEIAELTAVWYHIGLSDTETRVDVARNALEYMRNYECNIGAVETNSSDNITGYERTTVTLTRLVYPMFKYSEYTDMGHTPGPCYKDEALFSWLFNHSLKYR